MSAPLHGFCAVSRLGGPALPAPPRARAAGATLTSHGSDAARSHVSGRPSTAGTHRTS